jgi:hypothetical protein
MIQQVRALLAKRGLVRTVIIDDAFDECPRPGDVADGLWDRLFDDWSESESDRVSDAYGREAYEARNLTELRRDSRFVGIVWENKSNIPSAMALFSDFERDQQRKLDALIPLQDLVRNLGLECKPCGSDESAGVGNADIANADIVFLDLFLGHFENDDAIERALKRVKAIVEPRRDHPPIVVLLSASPRLPEAGPLLRDEAELLGCQFRMVLKSELADPEAMLERLYELAISQPDALSLNAFLLSWSNALDDAKTAFLRSIRTLDLADYANMEALILEAEGEPVGDYILDLYDLHLHSVLEGDGRLVRAAKALNKIKWADYPPAQFMPSPELIGIMDGALFHNQVRTDVEAEIEADDEKVRLGDVFLGPEPQASGSAQGATADDPHRYAYVVLSQACDLQHGEADRLIVLRGRVRLYSWRQHDNKQQKPRTPIMSVGKIRFSVEWDVLAPETWLLNEMAAKRAAGYQRVRRFRMPFALQLQQAFIGRLGRVGTLAALPNRYAAGVRVFLRDRNNKAKLLAEAQIDADKAVCMVGRTGKNALKEWLLLSDGFLIELRRALRDVPEAELPSGTPRVADLRENPEFFRQLKKGLSINREVPKGSKPFLGSGHDIVQIMTSLQLGPNDKIEPGLRPLVFDVTVV